MAVYSLWQTMKRAIPFLYDPDTPPIALQWRSHTVFIVFTIAFGMFTDMFLYSLIVPVIPFMLEDRLRFPEEQIQTLTSGLLAAFAAASMAASPIAGFLADRFSNTRRVPFLLGLVMLAYGTGLLALAQTVPALLLARALQGASSGVVWAVGLAVCMETVGPDHMGKTIGTIFTFLSVGCLFAPVAGGILYASTGYAGIFWVSVGLLMADFYMRLLVIEKRVAQSYMDASDEEDEEESSQDDEESPLLQRTCSNDFQGDEVEMPQNDNWLGQKVPIITCLGNMNLIVALIVCFVQAILIGSFEATIPVVASEYFSADSKLAGPLMLPLGVSDLFLGPFAGRAVDRYGTKLVATIGYGYLSLVLILLRLPHPDGTPQVALYAFILTLCGLGLSIVNAPGLVEASRVIDKVYREHPERFGSNGPYGQLYGLNSMVWSGGLAVGPLLAGSLKDFIGYGNMAAVMAGLSAFTAALSFCWLGSSPQTVERVETPRVYSLIPGL